MKKNNPLKNLKIASPCLANWEEMFGTDRKRYCGQCKLNVYNLSEMSKREAEDFLLNAEGSLCVRFYQRQDGTILTQDCPVGWRNLKRRISHIATAFASLIFGIMSGLGMNHLFSNAKAIGQAASFESLSQKPNSESNTRSIEKLSRQKRQELRRKLQLLLYGANPNKKVVLGRMKPLQIGHKKPNIKSENKK